ncbi:MAG: hypothetical protein QXH27_01815 [Candidatus Micrarchaeia archaeon]
MREIVLKRLFEIRESLLEIKPKLTPGSEIYKQVEQSLAEIDRVLKGQDLSKLPREVRIDTSGLRMEGSKLTGRVLMTDNKDVYDIYLENNRIVKCEAASGGFKKMEFLQMHEKPV